ncbi:MAG: hypothetical protein KKE73_11260 [Proteobacteria bacterium]|nr:hypothetical protein [Pseudomonadota bacterium]
MRAGQEVRAKRVAFIEAARSFSRTGLFAANTSAIKTGLPSGLRARQILAKAREIIKYYSHWESRIEHIDVHLPPALDPGENAALLDRGTLIDKTDASPLASGQSAQSSWASVQSFQSDAPQDEPSTAAAESGRGILTDSKT